MVAIIGVGILGFCLSNVQPDFLWDRQAREIETLKVQLEACQSAPKK